MIVLLPQKRGGAIPDVTHYQDQYFVVRDGSGLFPPPTTTGLRELQFTGGSVPFNSPGDQFMELIKLRESHVYGSSRVGIERHDDLLEVHRFQAAFDTGTKEFTNVYGNIAYSVTPVSNTIQRELGGKHYELANHLGNILEVVSDKLIATSTDGQNGSLLPSGYYPCWRVLSFWNGNAKC